MLQTSAPLLTTGDYVAVSLGTNELLLNDGDGHFTLAPSSPFHLEPISMPRLMPLRRSNKL